MLHIGNIARAYRNGQVRSQTFMILRIDEQIRTSKKEPKGANLFQGKFSCLNITQCFQASKAFLERSGKAVSEIVKLHKQVLFHMQNESQGKGLR